MVSARYRIALAASAATAGFIGCSAFALDGFSGGAQEASDASVDGRDLTSENDASAQPSTADASADATGDAGDGGAIDPDAGACVVTGMTTRICDGFERSMGVLTASSPENWSGSADVEFVASPSGTGQIARFTAGSGAGSNDSFFAFQAGDAPRSTIRGRIRVATAPATSARQLLVVKFSGSSMSAQLTVAVAANGALTMNEQIISGSGAVHTMSPMPAGWHRFVLEVDLVQDRAAFFIDGVSALPSAETFPHLPSFPSQAAVTISVGARYSAGTPFTDVEYDDVVVATATQ